VRAKNMVNKKGRRKATKQTKSQLRKNKKRQHFRFATPTGTCYHKLVNDQWLEEKTLQMNYKNMGLVTSVNSDIKRYNDKSHRLRHSAIGEMSDASSRVDVKSLTDVHEQQNWADKELKGEEVDVDQMKRRLLRRLQQQQRRRQTRSSHSSDDVKHDASNDVPDIAPLKDEMTRALQIEVEGVPPYVPTSMSINEQRILLSLRNKYGDNIDRMARDSTVNMFQWTASQLRKRLGLYDKLLSL